MRVAVLLCVLVSILAHVWGANILAVMPFMAKSHFMYAQSILTALADRGHSITMVGPIVPSKPVLNLKHILINTEFEKYMKDMTFDRFKEMANYKPYYGFNAPIVWSFTYSISEEVLRSSIIQNIITSNETFDLLMTETLFGQESLLVLGHLLNIPTVNLQTFAPWSVVNQVHGNDLQIATYPDVMSFQFSNNMSFIERFRNLLSTLMTLVYYHNVHLQKHEEIIRSVFKDPSIPPLCGMLTNISLTLANFHPTVGYAQPLPPNIIPVPGVNIAAKLEPLPKDIQEFMDRGKKSVIYFSLGTVIPVHMMPSDLLQMFLNVFRKLPYRVLWKIDIDSKSLPMLPNNVMVAKWFPQQSILAHPNTVLFITHGGVLSQQEAIHAGVPVIGMPFFGDQPFNVRLYEHLGIGVGLDFFSLTETTLAKTIMTIAGDTRYSENAKKWSKVFRHQPMSSLDTAVYWLEYLLRHKGAHHLRPVSATLPWYKLYLIDVIAFIASVVFLTLYLFVKLLSLLFRSCRSDGTSKVSVPTKKKKN